MSDAYEIFGVRFGVDDEQYWARSLTETKATDTDAIDLAQQMATGNYGGMHNQVRNGIGVGEIFRLEVDRTRKCSYVCIDLTGISHEFLIGNPVARIPYLVYGQEHSFFSIFESSKDHLILKVETARIKAESDRLYSATKHIIETIPIMLNFVQPELKTTSIMIGHEDCHCHLDDYRTLGHNGFHPPVRAARLAID